MCTITRSNTSFFESFQKSLSTLFKSEEIIPPSQEQLLFHRITTLMETAELCCDIYRLYVKPSRTAQTATTSKPVCLQLDPFWKTFNDEAGLKRS